MILETERLILRKWQESDAEELFRYASDPEVADAAGWPVHTSAEGSREIIRFALSGEGVWAVCLKETGLPVGSICLGTGRNCSIGLPEDEGEIGFWLGKPCWGKGYTTEALREIARFGFEEMGLKRLWCACFADNIASVRVQDKCGFVYAGDKQVTLMGKRVAARLASLEKSEWENSNS